MFVLKIQHNLNYQCALSSVLRDPFMMPLSTTSSSIALYYPFATTAGHALMKTMDEAALALLQTKLSEGTGRSLRIESKCTVTHAGKSFSIFGMRLTKKSRIIFMQDQGRFIVLAYLPNHEYDACPFLKPEYVKNFLKKLGLIPGATSDEAIVLSDMLSQDSDQSAGASLEVSFAEDFKRTSLETAWQGVWIDKGSFFQLNKEQSIPVNGQPVLIQGGPGTGKSRMGFDLLLQSVARYCAKRPSQDRDESGSDGREASGGGGGGGARHSDFALSAKGFSAAAQFSFIAHGAPIVAREAAHFAATSSQLAKSVNFIVPKRDLYGDDCCTIQDSLAWITKNQRSYSEITALSAESLFQEFTLLYALKGNRTAYRGIRGETFFSAAQVNAVNSFFQEFQKIILIQTSVEGFKWPEKLLPLQKTIVLDEIQGFTIPEIIYFANHAQEKIIFLGDSNQTQNAWGTDTFQLLGPMIYLCYQKTNSDQRVAMETIVLKTQYRCANAILDLANEWLILKYEIAGGLTTKGSGLMPLSEELTDLSDIRYLTVDQIGAGFLRTDLNDASCEWVVIAPQKYCAEAQDLFGQKVCVLTPEQAQGLELKVVVLYKLFEYSGLIPVLSTKRLKTLKQKRTDGTHLPTSLARGSSVNSAIIGDIGSYITAITRASEGVWIIESDNQEHTRWKAEFLKCLKIQQHAKLIDAPRTFFLGESTEEDWIERIRTFMCAKNHDIARHLFATHIVSRHPELEGGFAQWCQKTMPDIAASAQEAAEHAAAEHAAAPQKRSANSGAAAEESDDEYESVHVKKPQNLTPSSQLGPLADQLPLWERYVERLFSDTGSSPALDGNLNPCIMNEMLFQQAEGNCSLWDRMLLGQEHRELGESEEQAQSLPKVFQRFCKGKWYAKYLDAEFFNQPCPASLKAHVSPQIIGEYGEIRTTFEALVLGIKGTSPLWADNFNALLQNSLQKKSKKGWPFLQAMMKTNPRLERFVSQRGDAYGDISELFGWGKKSAISVGPVLLPSSSVAAVSSRKPRPQDLMYALSAGDLNKQIKSLRTLCESACDVSDAKVVTRHCMRVQIQLGLAMESSISMPTNLLEIREIYNAFYKLMRPHKSDLRNFEDALLYLFRMSMDIHSKQISYFFQKVEFMRYIMETLKIALNRVINYIGKQGDPMKSHHSSVCYAIKNANTEVAKLCMGHSCSDIHSSHDAQTTLLMMAVFYKKIDLVRYIISVNHKVSGAKKRLYFNSVNIKMNGTALECACLENQVDIALLLLDAGADPFVQNTQMNTSAFIITLMSSNSEAILEKILSPSRFTGHTSSKASDVLIQNGEESVPLVIAIHAKQSDNAKILMKYGANCIYVKNNAEAPEKTPLYYAVSYGLKDVVQEILKRVRRAIKPAHRRDPPSQTEIQWENILYLSLCVALSIVEKKPNMAIAAMLIEQGIIPYRVNLFLKKEQGVSLMLYLASKKHTTSFLTQLIEDARNQGTLVAGLAVINQRQNEQNPDVACNTILSMAIKSKQTQNAILLIQAGADVFWTTPQTQATALTLALKCSEWDVVRCIVDSIQSRSAKEKQAYLDQVCHYTNPEGCLELHSAWDMTFYSDSMDIEMTRCVRTLHTAAFDEANPRFRARLIAKPALRCVLGLTTQPVQSSPQCAATAAAEGTLTVAMATPNPLILSQSPVSAVVVGGAAKKGALSKKTAAKNKAL